MVAAIVTAVFLPGYSLLSGIFAGVFGVFALIGLYDVLQTKHAILRNYPILAHLRYFFEAIRPEMRQ